jgi:hypothetical protein
MIVLDLCDRALVPARYPPVTESEYPDIAICFSLAAQRDDVTGAFGPLLLQERPDLDQFQRIRQVGAVRVHVLLGCADEDCQNLIVLHAAPRH